MDIEKLKEAKEYLVKCFMYMKQEEPDEADQYSNFCKHTILKALVDKAMTT